MPFIHLFAAVISFSFISTIPVSADPPELYSASAVMIDAETGRILFEKDADRPIPPASLTKLVSMHVVLSAIRDGRIAADDVVPLPPESWAINMPPRSSLMFLAPGQRVTVWELLKGLAVASGNDASYALAYYVKGSVDAFVAAMNQTVRELGYRNLHFEEPSGISEHNMITAREFAFFVRDYIRSFPEALADLHSLRELAYPMAENLPPGHFMDPIVQQNRNTLLFDFPGVDGLKTGFIFQSGFNLALTASNGGMRLIAVTLGASHGNGMNGTVRRHSDGRRILEYGFSEFITLPVLVPPGEPIRIWKGRETRVSLPLPESVSVTVRRDSLPSLKGRLTQTHELVAPIEAGTVVGSLVYASDEGELHRVELRLQEDIGPGPWWRRVLHSVMLFLRGLAETVFRL